MTYPFYEGFNINAIVNEFQRTTIDQALIESQRSVSGAAKLLGIARNDLIEKMESLQIQIPAVDKAEMVDRIIDYLLNKKGEDGGVKAKT